MPLLNSRVTALLAAAFAACASPKQAWRPQDPEALIDLLPARAELTVDGVPLGSGGRTIAVPDPKHAYVLRATASGFVPLEHTAEGSLLAGARVVLVLRPEGFGDARRLDADDSASLAAAATLLVRRGRHAEAIEYAQHAIEVAPDKPEGHRVLADAAYALRQLQRAVEEYSAYLRTAPTAPDRREIERRVERLRGDMTISAEHK